MGRATRWLRSLLGGKKDAKAQRDNASYNGCEAKDKKRWSFTQTRPPSAESPCHSPASALEVAWLRSFYDDGEEESKHAIAVAVATAAAANAAVTAAQAAMVRLKSLGRERTAIHGSYEWWAAVKIQTAFRCYLAKKALRALKGLVKLQALVRGFLVRKQAAITLRRLQALIRAQSAARPREPRVVLQQQGQRLNAEFCHRRSFERFHTREAARCKHMASEQSYGLDRSPKIVEMDTFQPKSKSFRSALEEPAAMPISSPLQYLKIPSRLSIPRCRNSEDYHCFRNPDMSAYSKTAQNTPRLRPWAPARSTSADGAPRHTLSPSNCPNYMASTTSFVAKARAQSAPKQRAENASPRKKLLASEVAEYMTGVSGGGGGRSPLPAQEEAAYDLKCGKVGKIDRSPKAVRGAARDRCMDGMW